MKPAKSAKSVKKTGRRTSSSPESPGRGSSRKSASSSKSGGGSRRRKTTAAKKPVRFSRKELASKSKTDLVRMAKRSKVRGADKLTKPELVEVLGASKGSSGEVAAISTAARRTHAPNGNGRAKPGVDLKRVDGLNGATKRHKGEDRVILMVRDPYWLHVFWEISTDTVQRTEVALGGEWYRAKPVLRVVDVSSTETTITTESTVRDIEIHGGVNNWYIDVDGQARSYRVDLGYRSESGRFYSVARSNIVRPPRVGAGESADNHFQSVRADCERIYALSGGTGNASNSDTLQQFFEDRLRRPLSAGSLSNYGSGALGAMSNNSFHFELDAELIVFGKTKPDARVTIGTEPVRLRRDGSFTVRMGLANGRQILPATAETHDGVEVRTIVLSVERNTKELEPLIHDGQEL